MVLANTLLNLYTVCSAVYRHVKAVSKFQIRGNHFQWNIRSYGNFPGGTPRPLTNGLLFFFLKMGIPVWLPKAIR